MKRQDLSKLAVIGGLLLLMAYLLFGHTSSSIIATPPLHTPTLTVPTVTVTPVPLAPQLHVSGNQLFDSAGRVVRLLGANRSGTEYSCLHDSVFDGPSNQASISAMLSWHINAIRIPLNEDCWLNINMGTSPYGGQLYQQAIERYVQLLIANGITPILDLHWSAPGKQRATGLKPMPDRDHSPAFWSQVASAFTGNDAVIFDLFNEPYPDHDRDTLQAWECWRDGTNPSTCPPGTAGLDYNAAGMQELVDAVRATGATNVIMVGGIQYASTLDRWLDFAPADPAHELAVSWHLYNYSQCNLRPCWGTEGLPVMKLFPVITGEIGENDQGSVFLTRVMNFLDHPGENLPPQSYLVWVWNTDMTVYDLITDYTSGHPTIPYGQVFRQHLLEVFASPP
jgi:endoglucanase